MKLISEKVNQAIDVLKELDIDLWLVLCRETITTPDPVVPLVVGSDVVSTSAFMINKKGQTIAILSAFDAANFRRAGIYKDIIPYTESFSDAFKENLLKQDPTSIAINYSLGSPSADGLSYGLYLKLLEYLKETPYLDSLISAEPINFKVRSRKSETELQLLEESAVLADQCWHKSISEINVGMTEIQIADLISQNMKDLGVTKSFPTIVNAGAKTSAGHGSPTEAVLGKGDLLHVDMGVKYRGYCSDIQRLAYFKKDGEISSPAPLKEAFKTVKRVIEETARNYKTGVKGYEIHSQAKGILVDNNYPELKHALGHQIGREVHDGGALIGPKWEKYGDLPTIPLEKNNAFTVELGIELDGIGYSGLEEDLIVTDDGGRFISPRQTELIEK